MYVFSSPGYIRKRWIAVSYGSSYVFEELLDFFRMAATFAFQQCMRVPISLHPHWHLLLFVFLILVVLVGVKWYLILVLICISLMTNDREHLCMYLLSLHIFFGEMSICILWLFFIWVTCVFYSWIARALYIFWVHVSWHIYALQIFSPILCVVFLLPWWNPL